MELFPILEDIGLSKSEIALYLALLELGTTTSGPLISKTKLHNSVVHRSLKSMIAKGIISVMKKGPYNQYQAIEPRELLHYFEVKRSQLSDILPELEKRKKVHPTKSSVEMFVGKKAIFRLLNNIITQGKKKEPFLSFSLIEAHEDEEVIRFYKQYNVRRSELGLKAMVLVNKKAKKIYESHYPKRVLKLARVKYTHLEFPQGVTIFQNYVVFITWGPNPIAIKTTNEVMANQYRKFFTEFYKKEKYAYGY